MRTYWLFSLVFLCSGLEAGHQALPADITFLAIDLKYSKEHGPKICEVQAGSYSRFRGFDYSAKGMGLTGEAICAVIDPLVQRLYYLTGDVCDDTFLPVFKRYGWESANTLKALTRNKKWAALARTPPKDPGNVSSYPLALYVRGKTVGDADAFRRRYPGVLLLDASCIERQRSKSAMNKLFQSDPTLARYKATWAQFPKKYSKKLADKILKTLKTPTLVIKPIGAYKGRGIIIVTREELDGTLRKILRKPRKLRTEIDDAYSWWAQDSSRKFIVEEFAPTDPIAILEHGGRRFDATLRFSVVLVYTGGKATIHFVTQHMILPPKSLDEAGTLTELHKSRVGAPNYVHVPEYVRNTVQAQLREPLLRLYRIMLKGSS